MQRSNARLVGMVLALFVVAAHAVRVHLGHSGAPTRAHWSADETWEAKVVTVTDGDTLAVLRDDGEQVSLRLYGVIAPGVAQAWGDQSRLHLSQIAMGETVLVEPKGTDRRGRTVAEVFTQRGQSAGEEQIRAGLAWWYRSHAKTARRLETLQAEAQAARRGLWADEAPVPPWEFDESRK